MTAPPDLPETFTASPLAPADDAGCASPRDFDRQFADLAQLAYRVAFRLVGQREEARDIAQETMTRAYARWPKVWEHAPGWVSRVSTNLALDHLRRRRPATDRSVGSAGKMGATGTDHATTSVERAELVDALRRLPRRQRDVVVLRHLADLPEAEVARALDCSPGTVKSHSHRGLAALRRSLGPTFRPDEGNP